jgi:hypothetical protein
VFVDELLAAGRAAAEELMVDACSITRVTGRTTADDGTVTPTTASVYTGRCRVQQSTAISAPEPDRLGQALVFQVPFQLQLPMTGTDDIRNGDQVVVTDSVDSDLVDRRFWVKGVAHKTHATARRLGLEEVTS